MNRYLVKATTVGALGGLLFGFDTAVIGTTRYQERRWRTTQYEDRSKRVRVDRILRRVTSSPLAKDPG